MMARSGLRNVAIAVALLTASAFVAVASAVARVAAGAPLNGMVEVAGPERFRFDEFIRRGLRARSDPREVVADPNALYFGARLSDLSLIASGEANISEIRFQDWLSPATSLR